MKVTTTEIAPCEVLVTIELDPKAEESMLRKAAKRIAREVRVPGFRPGKAPFNTIIRRFGRDVVRQEALEEESERLVKDALDEIEIEPYAEMELDEINWDPLVIKLKIPTAPEVELNDYYNLDLAVEPVEVTEEDVQEQLEALQEQFATWIPVERPAEMGDLISMTYTEETEDDILAEDESAEYELEPPDEEAEEFQPDFATHLLGLSAGDSKTFTITYPEDYEDEFLAGEDVSYTVEVSGVKAKELDPLDDDFARLVNEEVDTLEELTQNIHTNLQQREESQRDFQLGLDALDQIIEEAEKIIWPSILEEDYLDEELKTYEYEVRQRGLTLADYLKLQNKTEEELREELRAKVQERLKRSLVLVELADRETLQVTQGEILEQAKRIADYSGLGDQFWQEIMSSSAQQSRIANDVLLVKVAHRLADIIKGDFPEEETEEEALTEEAEEPTDAEETTEPGEPVE